MTFRRAPHLLATALAASTLAVPSAAGAADDPPRYQAYYDLFNRGNALIPGDDMAWVPQGLAYWPDRDALIISYYDGDGTQNSRLAVIDRKTGAKQAIFVLPEAGHVGGIAMSERNLYVASSGNVGRITEASLAAAPDGSQLSYASNYPLAATSFASYDGKNLWVGLWEPDAAKARYAYRYPLGADDKPGASYAQRLPIPTSVQGMGVANGIALFSRSGGSGIDADSILETHPIGDLNGRPGKSITAPNMSEGIAVGHGKVHVVYESASSKYAGADYRVKTVHHAKVASIF